MICNLCRKLEAPLGKHYCHKCAGAMNAVWPSIEAAARSQAESQAMLLLHPPTETHALPVIDAWWQAGDVIRAIRGWMRLTEESAVLLYIPGSDTFSEDVLKVVSTMTGYIIRRTVDRDILYVEGK